MNIIRNENFSYMAVLGLQPLWKNMKYVWGNHCLIIDVDNGKLVFNSLTRGVVYLSNYEYNDLSELEYLYRYYYLVPEDFNSIEVIDNIREKLKVPVDDYYLNHPNEFTILPTTMCNARCFYCYEENSNNKHHMKEETAIKIAKYIEKTAYKQDVIRLDWFGGEPLFNAKPINIITNYLKKKNRTFTSHMTSNGYLFSETLVNKAVKDWNLKDVQITIDGTEKVYNKAKNYIYKDESPYKTLLTNINRLLDKNVEVTIRINIDLYNIDDIQSLIKELYSKFETKINIYLWPLFRERLTEEENELFKKLEILESLLIDYGYSYGQYAEPEIAADQCMADCGHHVTISPDGDLGTCEHYIDSKFFGHIDSEEKNYDVLNSWREYEKPLDICKSCPIYGSCIRPSECVEMSKCSENIKKWRLRKATQAVLTMYNEYEYNTRVQ